MVRTAIGMDIIKILKEIPESEFIFKLPVLKPKQKFKESYKKVALMKKDELILNFQEINLIKFQCKIQYIFYLLL